MYSYSGRSRDDVSGLPVASRGVSSKAWPFTHQLLQAGTHRRTAKHREAGTETERFSVLGPLSAPRGLETPEQAHSQNQGASQGICILLAHT